MSDRGDEDNGRHSRNGSMSGRSEDDCRIVTYKSRSKEPSKSPSGSPAKLKYRSRSRSRSHHRSRRSRSHRRSRSRSLHRYRSRYSRSFTHSRSMSYSPVRGSSRRYCRSHSRSPMSNRRRHTGTRENPKQNKCLGVFGLSIHTSENQLHHIFGKFGCVNKVQVVIDAKSGRSRGFAFVYFDSIDDAKNAKDNCSGMEIDGRKIRVDFSITQRAHTPTPGIYMGKPTYSSDVRWRDDDYYGGGGGGRSSRYDRYRRSPSPYYSSSSSSRRRRYERSRSRSYSPSLVRRGYG